MTNVDNPKQFTILSLCSGYGGLELGLSRALANPFRVVAVEIEAYALANLVAKAERGKLAIEALWPDLKTFPAERFSGCFDFILAGYPCQPFSCAGKRQGKDDPRHLWPHIARIVQAVQPLWCFFENVAGHLTLGFPEVYRSLRDMGYSVEAGLFTASECGLSFEGERLFILAQADRHGCEHGSSGKSGAIVKTKRILTRGRWEWAVKRLVGSICETGRYRWESQPRIRRSDDGASEQVDRLRLLGNGVVPQQAELAFRHLFSPQPQ